MKNADVKSTISSKIISGFLLGIAFLGFFIHGSTKRSMPPAEPAAPLTTSSDFEPVVYVENLHRYFAPTCFPADISIFTRPTNAITPSLWRRHSVCDDFQVTVDDYIAGACGVVTTQPWGIDNLEAIKNIYQTFAPFYATNSLIVGTSDFWTVTNDYSKTFVWKNAAFQRDPSQLVSFALTLYNWGDIDFTYGETVPESGFSSFVKIGGETVDMTALAAPMRTVRLEKNLNQDTEWWLENYPEICHTNQTGALIFEYDTNEWYFVEFRFGYDEAVAAYKRDLEEYNNKWNEVLSLDENHKERYITLSSNTGEKTLKDLISRFMKEDFPDLSPTDIGFDLILLNPNEKLKKNLTEKYPNLTHYEDSPGPETNLYKFTSYNWLAAEKYAGEFPEIQNYVSDYPVDESSIPGDESGQTYGAAFSTGFPKGTDITIYQNGGKYHVTKTHRYNIVTYTNFFQVGRVYKACTTSRHYRLKDLTGQCKIWRSPKNGTDFYFTRKIDLNLKGAAFTDLKNYTKVEAETKPPLSMGAYSWKTSDNLRVISSERNYADIEWKDGKAGFIQCIWDNGDPGEWKYSVTNTKHIAGVSNFNSYSQYLHLAASPKNVVFYSPHLDKNGILKEAGTTNITLSCSYGGTQPGRLELSRSFGTRAILTRAGAICTLPTSWEVSGPDERTFVVTGLTSGDAETFTLKYTGATVSDGYETTATVTATSVEVEADRAWPEMRKRRVFGPGEPFTITVNSTTELKRTASIIPGDYTENIPLDGFSMPVTYSVIAPSGCIGINARVMNDDDWIKAGYSKPLSPGEIGAGLYVDLRLTPDYVSFQGLKTMEGECAAENIEGYFSSFDMSQVKHDAANGAWHRATVNDENLVGFDRAGYAKTISELPPPWDIGGYKWHIPFYWSADDFTTITKFTTNTQSFRLYPSGEFSISKFGWTAYRSTNGVQRVFKE